MATRLGSLLIELGLDSARFKSGLDRAGRDTDRFKRSATASANAVKGALAGMVAGLSIGLITQAINKGLEYASALGEQAAQAGVTASALQEYRYAATQAGLTSEQMDGALARLTRTLGQAASGSKAQVEAFRSLGVAVRDSAGNVRNAADVMPDLADAISKLGSDAERGAALNGIFGRSGQALAPLMADGAAGVNGLRDAAHSLGIVLSDELIDAADGAADKMAEFNMLVDARNAAFIAENAQGIYDLASAMETLQSKAYGVVAALAALYRNSQAVNAEVARLQAADGVSSNPGFLGISIRRRVPNEPVGGYNNRARTNLAVRGAGDILGGLVRNITGQGNGRSGGRVNAPQGEINFNDDLTGGGGSGGGGGRSRGGGGGASAAAREAATATREYESAVTSLRSAFLPIATAQAEFAEQSAAAAEALRRGGLNATEYATVMAGLRDKYANGGEGATDWLSLGGLVEEVEINVPRTEELLSDLATHFEDQAQRMQEAAEKSRQALYDTLGSLRNFANSLQSGDIVGIIEGVLGLLEGIGGMVGGLNIGGVQFGNTGAASRTPGFATGTNFAPGGMAWVGERGKELVNLPRGSQVIPNHKLGEMGGARVEVVPSPYFNVVVDGRIQGAAPAIAGAGTIGAMQVSRRLQSRSLVR